jgi:hypothetical protein
MLQTLALTFLLLFPLTTYAQVRRQVAPAPSQQSGGGDFGSKFFDDLRSLFGRLQRLELDRAFQAAKPIRCSDLAGQAGEWKEVAFLNDDRKLGDWHFDNLEDVKSDLVAFVFSGTCRSEQGALRVATSYPVTESMEEFRQGKIPFSKIVINDNDPVSVIFDQATGSYTFQLPYVYAERQNGTDIVYTLTPPRKTSNPEPGMAIEFRCKALSDTDLTYRFLLCRSRVVNLDKRYLPGTERPSLGSAAYYILSDGKEASSTVRLNYGGDVDSTSNDADSRPHLNRNPADAEDQRRASQPVKVPENAWEPAPPNARLTYIADDEFRLRFNPQTWTGRIDKQQMLVDGNLSAFVSTSLPARSKEYCVWRPGLPAQVNQLISAGAGDAFGYSLAFRKDLQSAISSVFEIQADNGIVAGTLQCYFPQSPTPADLTVGRWISIVGKQIELDVRRR